MWVAAILAVVLAPQFAGAALIEVLPTAQLFVTNDPTSVATSVDIVVTIGPDENIYALRMDIMFDDSVLFSDTDHTDFTADISDGGMFTGAGGFFLLGDDFASNLYDDVTGTLVGQVLGLGAGVYTFASVTFTGVGFGTSPVQILDYEAADELNNPVQLAANDGSITIRPEGVIPEPATLAMVAAGIGALAFRRRRA